MRILYGKLAKIEENKKMQRFGKNYIAFEG